MIAQPLSALDFAVIEAGRPAAGVLRGTAPFAQALEGLGYRRVWFAEHHHSRVLGAFPPPVTIAHAAAATSGIRLGSGGVLAPNHAPLTLAEQFATLAALHPGRIDLGIGRGPGTFHEETARALRRGADPATNEEYHRDVAATLDFLTEVHFGELPEPWLLASSDAGASLAAALGVPLAFAHHMRPENTVGSLERYREEFRPSRWCESPRVLLCVQTICADTRERAVELARPQDVVKANLMKGHDEGVFLSPADAARHEFTAEEEESLAAARERQALGTPGDVERSLNRIAESTSADELMLVTPVSDPAERLHSFELVSGLVPAVATEA